MKDILVSNIPKKLNSWPNFFFFLFLIQSGEGIELEEISDHPEVKSQEDAVLPLPHLPTLGKFRRMAIILDYFSFHILIHLTLIGLDSYIAYWLILSTFSNESTHFTAPTGRTVNDVVFLWMLHINVSYDMEFLVWWVLKSKVFAQKSTVFKWNCCVL